MAVETLKTISGANEKEGKRDRKTQKGKYMGYTKATCALNECEDEKEKVS